MKTLIIGLWILMSSLVVAHDGPHGSRISDAPLRGGVVAPVVEVVTGGHHDGPIRYKCELLRAEDGTVRLYFYTDKMVPIPVSKFSKLAKATLEFKQGKTWVTRSFILNQRGDLFVGALPKGITRRPYTIDIPFTENGRVNRVSFAHLD